MFIYGFGVFWEYYWDNIWGFVEKGNCVWGLIMVGFGWFEKFLIFYIEFFLVEFVRDFIIEVVKELVIFVGNLIGGE